MHLSRVSAVVPGMIEYYRIGSNESFKTENPIQSLTPRNLERKREQVKNRWWRWDSNPRTRRTAALTQRVWPLRYVILLHINLSLMSFIMFASLNITKLLHPFTQEIVLVSNCFVSFNKQMKDYIHWKLKNPEMVIWTLWEKSFENRIFSFHFNPYRIYSKPHMDK